MDEKERAAYPGRSGQTSSKVVHQRCQRRLEHAVQKSESKTSYRDEIAKILELFQGAYVKFMLDAMKKVGWYS